MVGHPEVDQQTLAIQGIDRYTALFFDYIQQRDRLWVLKDPVIVQEADERKRTFGNMVPKILSDIQHFTPDTLPGILQKQIF